MAWADRRIEQLDIPRTWLIDLSLSQNAIETDVISLLRHLGAGSGPVAVCEAIYALAPDGRSGSFAEAETLARLIYRIAWESLHCDWRHPLFARAAGLDDEFDSIRDGYSSPTREQAVFLVDAFINRHRDPNLSERLAPVRWSIGF